MRWQTATGAKRRRGCRGKPEFLAAASCPQVADADRRPEAVLTCSREGAGPGKQEFKALMAV